MNRYVKEDPWKIIEKEFDPGFHEKSESIFSLGNGHMGHRANFEEQYSGPSLQGQYLAGIYYPDKTKVGWWKVGYPEYFAKVINAPSWIGIHIWANSNALDLFNMKVLEFTRTLDMKTGLLQRNFIAEYPDGKQLKVETERFLHLTRREIGAIQMTICPLNFDGRFSAEFLIDGNISNQDANYDEKFWETIESGESEDLTYLSSRTKKTDFFVTTAQYADVHPGDQGKPKKSRVTSGDQKITSLFEFSLKKGEKATLTKIATVTTSRDYDTEIVREKALEILKEAIKDGFDHLKTEHLKAWEQKWNQSDITIEGDLSAQQGIRFNIFQLLQTYTGHDPRLNIGPKGFTGEKYGGSTYWDTEAFCLPFYLSTSDQQVSKNLLLYRYRQLDKAIENAKKLGFDKGAALYPMVTMNGEECHNEWEITFEEIHRNGAIAYAIMNYLRHTGDQDYLWDYGLEVLVAVSRFWAQRVNFSQVKKKYVILGVTGPNEYENNVNNNWYTNYIAAWTLTYTRDSLLQLINEQPLRAEKLFTKTQFNPEQELPSWEMIANGMYLPEDKTLGILLQQDGYLDKEQLFAEDLSADVRPLNQNWSWDRILRSPFIKQADVLQGLYFFEDEFDRESIRRNFDYYESRTVHESSLSPCIHAIIASKLGMTDKAYDLYLRTSRLDLDDYNNEVREGCHITSMAGTWLSVVEGFGGMRIRNDQLHFDPLLPTGWKSLQFKIRFRGRLIQVHIDHQTIKVQALDQKPFSWFTDGKEQFA